MSAHNYAQICRKLFFDYNFICPAVERGQLPDIFVLRFMIIKKEANKLMM
jgi:hypothetical protein